MQDFLEVKSRYIENDIKFSFLFIFLHLNFKFLILDLLSDF